jgi:hypothetical protein
MNYEQLTHYNIIVYSILYYNALSSSLLRNNIIHYGPLQLLSIIQFTGSQKNAKKICQKYLRIED